jgi:hypothetical protein
MKEVPLHLVLLFYRIGRVAGNYASVDFGIHVFGPSVSLQDKFGYLGTKS